MTTVRIYKLQLDDLIYIGSTELTLEERFNRHIISWNAWKRGTTNFTSSFTLFEKGTPEITLLHEYVDDTEDDDEVKKRRFRTEGEFQRKYPESVNIRVEGRTQKEYREDNKEYLNELCRKYYQEHHDQQIEYHRQKYNDNKDKILEHMKKYYEEHQDERKAYRKAHYEENREAILESRQKKYDCRCGRKQILWVNKARHERSQTHQAALAENNSLGIQ